MMTHKSEDQAVEIDKCVYCHRIIYKNPEVEQRPWSCNCKVIKKEEKDD